MAGRLRYATILLLPKKRYQSISSYLSVNFGGTWEYDNSGTWLCDDELRYARRVCSCSGEEDRCTCFPSLWVYGGPNGSVRA